MTFNILTKMKLIQIFLHTLLESVEVFFFGSPDFLLQNRIRYFYLMIILLRYYCYCSMFNSHIGPRSNETDYRKEWHIVRRTFIVAYRHSIEVWIGSISFHNNPKRFLLLHLFTCTKKTKHTTLQYSSFHLISTGNSTWIHTGLHSNNNIDVWLAIAWPSFALDPINKNISEFQ